MNNPFKEILYTKDCKTIQKSLTSFKVANEDLLNIALNNKHLKSWRALWILNQQNIKDDKTIRPFLNTIIHQLESFSQSHQRELLKILYVFDLSEHQTTKLFDLCLKIFRNTKLIASVRYYAFLNLLKILKQYPELKKEVLIFINDELISTLTPGIKKSVLSRLKPYKTTIKDA
jgi:ADP-dependent phosphofructokinase/glucokinase